jgi:hypothetical protein
MEFLRIFYNFLKRFCFQFVQWAFFNLFQMILFSICFKCFCFPFQFASNYLIFNFNLFQMILFSIYFNWLCFRNAERFLCCRNYLQTRRGWLRFRILVCKGNWKLASITNTYFEHLICDCDLTNQHLQFKIIEWDIILAVAARSTQKSISENYRN